MLFLKRWFKCKRNFSLQVIYKLSSSGRKTEYTSVNFSRGVLSFKTSIVRRHLNVGPYFRCQNTNVKIAIVWQSAYRFGYLL